MNYSALLGIHSKNIDWYIEETKKGSVPEVVFPFPRERNLSDWSLLGMMYYSVLGITYFVRHCLESMYLLL